MEATELRPLSLGELLDRTFTLYRAHFWVFVGIMAIPAAIGVPLNFFVSRSFVSSFGNPGKLAPVSPASFGFLWGFLGVIAVIGLASAILYAIVAAAVTFAVSEAYLGRSSTVAGAYRSVRGRVWRLLGVALNVLIRLLGIAIGISVVGMVGGLVIVGLVTAVPGAGAAGPAAAIAGVLLVLVLYVGILAAIVYLALRYAVAIPALMLEDLGVLASIRRSVQLTKGRRGQVFIALLLSFLISAVGSLIFYVPFYILTIATTMGGHAIPAWLSLAASVSSAVGRSLTGPIFLIVLVLCYYDTRIRKEAFDLQFMMASLDRRTPAAGTVPSA